MPGAATATLYAAGEYGGGNAGAQDVLDGGAGEDYLLGALGSQTYLFGRGDGKDTVYNIADIWTGQSDTTVGKQDVLQFKAGISALDVSLRRSGDHLIVKLNGSTDQVTVQNYFVLNGASPQGYALDAIRFDDGTSWNYQQVQEVLLQGGVITAPPATTTAMEQTRGQPTAEAMEAARTLALHWEKQAAAEREMIALSSRSLERWVYERGIDNNTGLSAEAFKRQAAQDLGGADPQALGTSALQRSLSELSENELLVRSQIDSLVQAMASFGAPPPGQTSFTPSQQNVLAPMLGANIF